MVSSFALFSFTLDQPDTIALPEIYELQKISVRKFGQHPVDQRI
jgi:hypothetical protein